MVGIDRFSRFGHAVALRNMISKTVVKALESYIFSSVSCTPEVIFTDVHPEFEGREFNEVLAKRIYVQRTIREVKILHSVICAEILLK